MGMNKTIPSKIILLLGVIGAVAAGVAVRRAVYTSQEEYLETVPPFTLESALHFRRINQVLEHGELPEIDKEVQYPEGIDPRAAYSLGDEYVFARLLQWWPGEGDISERLRWITVIWFSMGIAGLGLWVFWQERSVIGGVLASLCYAVMIASVIRSTGQELSRENFALPLLLWHLAFRTKALMSESRIAFWLSASASALLLVSAMISWDLIQFYIFIWAICGLIETLRYPGASSIRRIQADFLIASGLVIAGVYNPYLRAHFFLLSPLMLLVCGVIVARIVCNDVPWGYFKRNWHHLPPSMHLKLGDKASRRAASVAIMMSFTVAGLALAAAYTETYGHFGELIWAKIRFRNVKPYDPSLLTFSQRIMWVPALHSATWPIIIQHFPYILWLTLPVAGTILRGKLMGKGLSDTRFNLLIFHGLSFIAFVFFVRFHVFLAITSAVLVGCGVARDWSKRDWFVVGMLAAIAVALGYNDRELLKGLMRNHAVLLCLTIAGAVMVALVVGWASKPFNRLRAFVLVIFLLALAGESYNTLRDRWRWMRTVEFPVDYYADLNEMTDWLREWIRGEPVVASFGVSGSILAYGGCPILLHPKFEDPLIRQRVERYGELLFKEDEENLWEWMDELGVRYLVYSMGGFGTSEVPYRMRYMVDAVVPPPSASARYFERMPGELKRFRMVWHNSRYRVFRRITEKDGILATKRAGAALEAFQRGHLDEAERLALKALELNKDEAQALEILRRAGRLRQAGFRGPRSELE